MGYLAALHAADLLQVCDNGLAGTCPSMARAIRTWRFAIDHLEKALDGQVDAETMTYVKDIAHMTSSFAEVMTLENFHVVVRHNRQVFEAFRPWLNSQPKVEFDQGDMSLPGPMRGEFCSQHSCFEF